MVRRRRISLLNLDQATETIGLEAQEAQDVCLYYLEVVEVLQLGLNQTCYCFLVGLNNNSDAFDRLLTMREISSVGAFAPVNIIEVAESIYLEGFQEYLKVFEWPFPGAADNIPQRYAASNEVVDHNHD